MRTSHTQSYSSLWRPVSSNSKQVCTQTMTKKCAVGEVMSIHYKETINQEKNPVNDKTGPKYKATTNMLRQHKLF